MPTEEINQSTKEESNKMLTFEQVTMVNGSRATNLSTDALIGLVKDEQKRIDALFKLDIKSTAIDGIINKHEANIKSLIKIMDEQNYSEE